MKKFYTILAGLIVAAGSIFLFNFLGGISQAALPEDCDDNSIIFCGGTTPTTLATRYKENKKKDLPAIYNAYGLSAEDVTNAGSRAKMGEVTKGGRVIVGGKVVATGAKSIGRQNIKGSSTKKIGSGTYYERATSVSFKSNSIAAYVYFDANGDYRAAILTSCGNPVTAIKPSYKCDSLTAKAITRTKYSFTATASASNGATVTGYSFDFGDGKKTSGAAKTAEHEYATPGTYAVKLSVTVKVNGVTKTVTGAKCEVMVKVEKPPVTPVYTCDSLTASKISRTEYAFTGKATATGGATIVNYVINFGDGKSETVTNLANVTHKYDKPASYTTKMTANIKVGNETKAVTSAKCETPIKVEDVPVTPVYTCDSLTTSKISRLESTFTGKATAEGGATIENYTFDFGDGTTQTVPNPTDVKHTYAKEDEYTVKLTANIKVNNETKAITGENCIVKVTISSEECKPGIPVGSKDCEEECKPGVPVGDAKCEEVPVELPKTGPADMLFGTFGLGSVAAAAYYYVASRRGLLSELLNR